MNDRVKEALKDLADVFYASCEIEGDYDPMLVIKDALREAARDSARLDFLATAPTQVAYVHFGLIPPGSFETVEAGLRAHIDYNERQLGRTPLEVLFAAGWVWCECVPTEGDHCRYLVDPTDPEHMISIDDDELILEAARDLGWDPSSSK